MEQGHGHGTNFTIVAKEREGGADSKHTGSAPPYNLFSITPKQGSIGGSQMLVLRGKNFVDRDLKVQFRGLQKEKGKVVSVQALRVRFVNRRLIEVVCPMLFKFANQSKKFVSVHVSCAGSPYTQRMVAFNFLEKCQRVRKCLKEKGHAGRCCSDEGPPIYATQKSFRLPGGGKFSTACIGVRSKPIAKRSDAVPIYSQPKRPATPGGAWGNALVGIRTRKIGKDQNSTPIYGPVPANPISGGVISTANIGYRTKPIKKRDDTVPIYGAPKSLQIPGGRIGTAGLGYRTKKLKKDPSSIPVQPPPKPKVLYGGRFSTALIGKRTEPIKKRDDTVPQYGQPPRPPIPGGAFGNSFIGYRTNPIKKEEGEVSSTKLPEFGSNIPGGTFNMHGAIDRGKKIKKRPQSAPMYNVKGCGERILPGGRFNMDGSHKAEFRYTYLDEVGAS